MSVRRSGCRPHTGRQTQPRSIADALVARQDRRPMASWCVTMCGHTSHLGSSTGWGVVCGHRSSRTTVDPAGAGMVRSPVRGWVTGGERLLAPLIDDVDRRAGGRADADAYEDGLELWPFSSPYLHPRGERCLRRPRRDLQPCAASQNGHHSGSSFSVVVMNRAWPRFTPRPTASAGHLVPEVVADVRQ